MRMAAQYASASPWMECCVVTSVYAAVTILLLRAP